MMVVRVMENQAHEAIRLTDPGGISKGAGSGLGNQGDSSPIMTSVDLMTASAAFKALSSAI